MFDLDNEISIWCQRNYAWSCHRKSQLLELEDHLHCAVATFMADGLSPSEAFKRAVASLGATEALQTEYRKNWSQLAVAIRCMHDRPVQFSIAAVATAVVMGLALLLPETESLQWTRNMLFAIYTMPFKFFSLAF